MPLSVSAVRSWSCFALDHARAGDEEQGLVEPDVRPSNCMASALAEGVDDGHRLPAVEAILAAEIGRKRLAGMDAAGDEDASKPIRAAPSMSVWRPSPIASTALGGGSPARCSAWS